jgi:sigma-B regulation protein RsbU (phosphoserine phosphatase)
MTFKRLSRVDQAFLIALAVRLLFGLIATVRGVDPPGAVLVRLIFIVITIFFLILSGPRLLRKMLWRVRHRLLLTWVLLGVVPIVLIAALVGAGMYLLMGQVLAYMTTTEIDRRAKVVQSDAHELAWSVAHRAASVNPATLAGTFMKETFQNGNAEAGVVVDTGANAFALPADGPIRQIPDWVKPDFLGIVRSESGYYIASHIVLGDSPGKTAIFLYQHAPPEFFNSLLPGIATIEIDRGATRGRNFQLEETTKPGAKFSFGVPKQQDPDPSLTLSVPPGRGVWDIPVSWLVLIPKRRLSNGTSDGSFAVVSSRPSLILKNLFANLGQGAIAILVLLMLISAALCIVEVVALLFGATLTRSITRAVADLYEGTRKVQAGDFSHRIRIRRNKDQLSELAGSFNTMTGQIQNLIAEVKEKERLENELAIARDVQSRLFPKEVPALPMLEVWGGCQPARTVSGDYYDYVTLSGNRVALAIGDISGKGISAALLMAHIQSALRSQLMPLIAANGSTPETSISPAEVLSILNNLLYTSSPAEKYATFFLGIYADQGGQLIYTNAGHIAPMLVRRNQVLRLTGDGFPVGLFPGVQYEQHSVMLEHHDLFVAFTDGVTETPNATGEEFGEQRVMDLLIQNADKPLDVIAGEISKTVSGWAGDKERHDDTTVLLARRI